MIYVLLYVRRAAIRNIIILFVSVSLSTYYTDRFRNIIVKYV